MAFRLPQTPTFAADVVISIPDDQGRIVRDTVRVTYKRVDQEGLDQIGRMHNREACREVIVDVQGMVDDGGQPVPWTDATKEAFLAIPQATFACAAKFSTLTRMGKE